MSASVASRRLGMPSAAAAFSTAARRWPYWPSASRWRTVVSITSTPSPWSAGAKGTARSVPSRVSSSSACPAGGEQRGGLVHAAGRGPDHVVLGADARHRECPPARGRAAQPEPEQRVDGEGRRALQRRRRRQPRPERDGVGDEQVDPADRVPRCPQGPQHPGRVPRPAAGGAGADVVERTVPAVILGQAAQPHPPVGPGGRLHHGALADGEGQAESLRVVDVLADQVDAPRRGPAAVGRAPEELAEGGRTEGGRGGGGHGAPASRSRAAIRSGIASLIHAPAPDSEPARYLSLPGARRSENSCRCSRVRSRPVWTGAWCQPAM